MSLSELINEILSEWAYRVDDGQPNPKNQKHLDELGLVLNEMGLGEIKNELIQTINEADKQFTNPVLNKEIPYQSKDGTQQKGIVGNLLRLPKDHPGRIAAEKMLPSDEKGKDDAMKDLGSEKDGHSTIPQAKKEPKEEPKEEPKDKEGDGDAEAEKQKAIQAMFQDPAYKTARLDKEKEVQAKIASQDVDKGNDGGTFGTDEKDKIENPKEETPDFQPIDSDNVQKEMPNADADAFSKDSNIETLPPEERHSISIRIDDLAKMADEAKAKGEKAPNFNLCQISVPGTNLYCDNNLGIPRDQMPQFKGKPQPGSAADKMPKDKNGEVDTEEVFKKMLADKGIKTIDTEIPSDSLKSSQSELVGSKVAGMTKALEADPMNKGITAPIYVSRDGYVIDGHHRWAAMTSKAIKDGKPANMKVHVIDMDAKDIIPMANKFAENIGVAAKSADTGAGTIPSHKEVEKQSEVKTFKGQTSDKEIKSIEFGDGAQVFGVEHGDIKMVDDILNKVKSTIPKEKWKDIVFLGEGGSTDENGEMNFEGEQRHAADEFKKMGATIDSFDGDDMDVHNDQSNLYKIQKQKTGLSDTQIKAGNWASMIGQGEGTDTMSPSDYLDDEGKQFLQDATTEAGLPQIENWEEPTEQDKDTLYRLSFPEDNGDKETKVNDIQVAFNEARDENLLDKTKKLKAQGKIPITIAGEGHIDLLNKKEPKNTSLPKPEPADETPNGVVYNVGGNYYSDRPGGPAQYIKTESVLEKILVEGDDSYMNFLFEANVTKKTSKGTTIKLKTIDPKNQKKATVAANAEKQPSDLESNRQEIKSPTTEKEADGMRKFTDKSVTDSLKLSKSEVKAREEAIKIKYEKQVADWKKKKDAAKAKGIKFTETKPKPPSKGVGLGSPESRAGESAVVKGCLLMKQNYDSCMVKSKDSKKCYQAAREITESQLRKYVTKDSFLTNEWVDSAMATLDLIHNEIGFGNIQEIGWDNQEGRALVGSQGHGTSSDMFVKLKPSKNYHKGKRIGISLKKDLKVFIYSGGWATLQDKIAERGFQLSDASKIHQYLKRRNEELYEVKKFANDPDSKNKFCADLDNLKKHPERISSKPNVVASRMNDILKVTKAKNIKSLDCDTFINSVVNVAQTGDTMKIIGDMCKSSTDPELKNAYGRMRAIDREMTDSIATDFSKPENQKVVKKLVRDETHISDILFGENPNLDELKVVYGTDPAIEMKKEQLCQLFGIKDLYAKFEAEKDPKKKEAIKKKIEKAIDDKIVISTKGGVMSIAINVEGPDGKPSPLPLFEAKIRTRGFGNAPTFEMAQNTFGGLSFKYGHTDYNGIAVDKNGKKIHQPWSNEDKKIVVGSMMKDIMDDFQDDLDNLDDKTKAEIGLRLSKLENIYPNHPAVKKFKRDYLDAAKATVAKKAKK